MKALVLTGRKEYLSATDPTVRQLIRLPDKQALFLQLDGLAAQGIDEVGVVVGGADTSVEEALGRGSAFGLSLTYLRQDAPLGTAHAVLLARNFLGDEPFVLCIGDRPALDDVANAIAEFDHNASPACILYGEAPETDDQPVETLVRPGEPSPRPLVMWAALFTPAVHEAVRAISPSPGGRLELGEAIQWWTEEAGRPVRWQRIDARGIDAGTSPRFLQATRRALAHLETAVRGTVDAASRLEGSVVIEEGAHVTGSVVRGPAFIGAGAQIERSFVGPFTAVGGGCSVVDAEIEQSVLLEGARVHGVQGLTDSLVGRSAEVRLRTRRPAAHRFQVADRSVVRLPTRPTT